MREIVFPSSQYLAQRLASAQHPGQGSCSILSLMLHRFCHDTRHCIYLMVKADNLYNIIMATYNDLLDKHYGQELSITDE